MEAQAKTKSNASIELNGSFENDILSGLTASPKRLSSVYFYDEKGSQIFEEICDLDEYYLTRKETEILERSSHEIIDAMSMNTHLVELGSGSSRKTRILLEAALAQFTETRYSPIDVSAEILEESANKLLKLYPDLKIETVADLYEVGLEKLLQNDQSPDCIMWLGSSIGNLTRQEATLFMYKVRQELGHEDSFLLGVDLRKRAAILEPAYDDAKGVTAAFNLNLLTRINRELGGEFKLDKFQHTAVYNDTEGRIEMYLISLEDQEVWIERLSQAITFVKDEKVLTEYSYKYSQTEIESLAELSGFRLENQWFDENHWFSLNLFKPNMQVKLQ
jgi:dimethylhistidine N-methyltransferase